MAFEFKLPDIGEGVVEGELVKWLVAAGAAVDEDTPLFEVLTDKVSAVIPSPRKGIVTKRHFEEGDMVPVGSVVVTIEAPQEARGPVAEAGPRAKAPVGAENPPRPPDWASATPAAPTGSGPKAAASGPDPASNERVRAAPATRKLARELGIDLGAVTSSGEHGRVTREDVEKWARRAPEAPAGRTAAAPTATAQGADEERIRLRGLRRLIFQKMRESKDHAAHFTYVEEVDFTAIVEMRDALARNGLKTTFLPFVMKAVVLALKKDEFAYLNASIDEAAGEIVVKRRYHLGIAAATEAGLMVPVVRDVDRKTLRELAEDLVRLGEGARTGTLGVQDVQGSTFTITSLGKIGGMFATPIVNYPESAILGLHKVEKRPVVVDDQIVIRERMYMSCSFDHRLIDGHVGAAFVQQVRAYLEAPALLMAELV